MIRASEMSLQRLEKLGWGHKVNFICSSFVMFKNILYGITWGLELKFERYFCCKSDEDLCGICDLTTLKTYLRVRGFDKTAQKHSRDIALERRLCRENPGLPCRNLKSKVRNRTLLHRVSCLN